jgi:hypothetical protein
MYRLPVITSQITETHLLALIEHEIPEGKTIDYKLLLPGEKREDKLEFLKDVSAFANTAGGHLVLGMDESQGKATKLTGLPGINVDAEVLRLENLLRDGITPRLPGVSIQVILTSEQHPVIVLFVPRSWAQPHAVDSLKHWRFYGRNAAGSYPFDVGEVRAGFLAADSLNDRIQQFRLRRLAQIAGGDTPVALGEGGKIVLHLIPLAAADPTLSYDLVRLSGSREVDLGPIYLSGFNRRYNFDGLLTTSTWDTSGSYLQVFRDGTIESADGALLTDTRENRRYIPGITFEQELIKATTRFLKIQQHLEVPPPVVLTLSFLNVRGYLMASERGIQGPEIDRDDLIVPNLLLQEFTTDLHEVGRFLRPAFDSIWNAVGWPGSPNYNPDGLWAPRRP